jgi:hypothetical protein
MIRWNAKFVSRLAQSVLERARIIRGSLSTTPATTEKPRAMKSSGKIVKRAVRKAK